MNKLHAFCGPIYLDGWINLDKAKEYKTDICSDIFNIDFDENLLDIIYACHGLEHLSYEKEVVQCLDNFLYWLKPNGILRIAVPDLELAVRNYANGGDLKFLYGADFKGYYYRDTPCERLNFFVKEWQHTMCYDFPLLSSLVRDAGFRVVTRRAANETQIPNFYDDRFISESMYLEAIK